MSDLARENRFLVFLRKRDRYPQPINLTYNQLKNYPSTCGGVVSIVGTIVLLLWLSIQIKNIVIYKYTSTSTFTLLNTSGQTDEVWNMTN